jgi:transcriptional regulator with XRE-family HTH domain
MVRAWAPSGEGEISKWMIRRIQIDEQAQRGSSGSSISELLDEPLPSEANALTTVHGALDEQVLNVSKSAAGTVAVSNLTDEHKSRKDPSEFPELARLRLGTLLQQLRKRAGLNVKSVGYDSGCSYSTISSVLRGFSSPSANLLETILKVVRASEEEAENARRLLAEAKTTEQVYDRFSEFRNEEMIERYISHGQGDRMWLHPSKW